MQRKFVRFLLGTLVDYRYFSKILQTCYLKIDCRSNKNQLKIQKIRPSNHHRFVKNSTEVYVLLYCTGC